MNARIEVSKIQELFDEVELYKQAIQDAKDALSSAEQELDEELDDEWRKGEEYERKEDDGERTLGTCQEN